MPFRLLLIAVLLAATTPVFAAPATEPAGRYETEAREVTAYFQKTFWDDAKSLYIRDTKDRKVDYVWRQAAGFSVLVAAARHDPPTYTPLLHRHFKALDSYWDTKVRIPAYEPSPTRGNGNDKYYDDNAWLVITFLEGYQLTNDRALLDRARETANFVASGWDDKQGGGIWWHQTHKDDSKNTCANGPAALGYLRLAQLGPADESAHWITAAQTAVEWTNQKLQASDGLFDDRIIVSTGEVKKGKLTYNSALMLRANLGLYRATGKQAYLAEATRIGKAADWFLDKKTGVYRDALKWSQFMAEADIDLYRATGDEAFLNRAKHNVDAWYAAWKKEPSPEMMHNAGIARILWLLADLETTKGRAFWNAADAKR